MAKISTYPLADVPLLLSDRLIGTEAIRPTPSATPLATKNFSLGELLQLFSSSSTASTLQAVLDAGNTATQNITLTGTIDTTLIRPDNIEDTSGSQGTVFQFLSKGAVSINWVDLPVDNLQAVLNAGNTATQNINLVGNITSTRIIPGNIQDDTTGIGITGQFLSKTASGIRWVNAPATTTPGLGDVLSVGNTAINNINLTGNVTATSFIKTGGTNLQYLMADGSVSLGPTIVQLLTEQTIDAYIGSRLKPTNPLSNGFYFDRNVNGSVGYTAINTNTGNSAVVSHGVSIDSNSYIKNIITAKFGPNYFVSLLAGKGGLLGTEEVFVGSTDGNDVSILTGPTFSSVSRKFTVKADGQLLIQTTPTTGTTSDKLLVRDTSGNVKQISYPNIPSIPTLQEVLDEGDAAVDSAIFFSNTANDFETSINEYGDGRIILKSVVNDVLTEVIAGQVYLGTIDGSDNVIISKDGINVDTVNYAFPSGASSPLATLADISSGGVTSVTATSPITSSGGATPDISTSMATNKLIGRSTAGVGVMEEITIGTGLTLSGGTLSASATGGGIPHATAAGTDTYTATITGVTAYNDADAYLIRFTNGNTTGATLNINSLGAIPLYRNNDGVLIGGDIISGGEMLCVYNSTTNRFQVIGTAPNSLFAYVTNDDSVTLTKGMPVYAFGGTGDRMTVKRANNTGDATSAQTVGLVLSTSIAANQKGLIMMQGLLDGLSILPTSTWSDGDAVYLGSTPGSITNVKPFAPNHLVYLGVVTTASNGAAGRMYVRVQNGYELQELHNVQAQSPSLKDTLWYDNTVSPAQWKTASIPTILGFTPEDVANKQTNLTASATKYPTVNAVNTGLALKQNILSYTPYKNIQTSQTVHTGTTVETVLFTATIPAGAFSSTDIIKVLFGTNKLNVAGTYSLRLRLNTTNTISGAPTIALYNGTNTAQVNVMMRNFNLNGGNLYGFPFTTSGMTDIVALGASLGSTTLNPANQFFIFATVTLNNSLDNFIGNMLSISN